MQPVVPGFQQCIGPLRSIASCCLEAPGINDKGRADGVADCGVGMPVNYAINIRKKRQHSVFNIVPVSGAVAEADSIAIDRERAVFRQRFLGCVIAHIAVHGINIFSGKSGKNGDVGKVSGMGDDVTP